MGEFPARSALAIDEVTTIGDATPRSPVHWGPVGTGRCEKIDFKICSELGVKKIALGCRISDRWRVGKHLGSKIKSRKLKQINFFTSSCSVFSRFLVFSMSRFLHVPFSQHKTT
jgi:hypothetical protein